MNKAMIFPIHKKWVDKIFNGSKKFEFRNKLPKHLVKGMKIYFYETLGDRKIDKSIHKFRYIQQQMRGKNLILDKMFSDIEYKNLPKGYVRKQMAKEVNKHFHPYTYTHRGYGEEYDNECLQEIAELETPMFKRIPVYKYEGQGKIVGEATVGEIYNLKNAKYPKKIYDITGFSSVSFIANGFSWHDFAIELTNVIKYDKEWLEDKRQELLEVGRDNQISTDYWLNVNHAPKVPIAKEEFVLWNKAKQYYDKEYKSYMSFERFIEIAYDEIQDEKVRKLCVLFPPQAPIYVVEREVK
jgi:predicted transcriptional regulator